MRGATAFLTLSVVLSAASTVGLSGGGSAGVVFEEYFTEGMLRLDVIHSGTASEEEISYRRAVTEPVWGGPRLTLVAPDNAGEYVLEVRDEESGALIYRKGFNTLFGEWRTTTTIQTTRKAFEETYETPRPKRAVKIGVSRRGEAGAERLVFEMSIDPGAVSRGDAPSGSKAGVHELIINGKPENRVDLVILGDGYTEAEAEKFIGDCRHVIGALFAVEPFASMRDRFNVRAVHVPSAESGVDEPRKEIFRDTAFGLSFNTFGSERYCLTEDVWAIHDAASSIPHDAILLMANSSRYGGGAIFNLYTAFVSDNEYDDYLCVHEFGHGFAGLADEYFSSQVSYNEFYPRGVEPWEPNITALLDASRLKWGDLVEPGTPVPTPAGDARYHERLGAFEGAGYAAKGLYRPAVDCKMFSKANREFCGVCRRAVADAIRFYAPE